MTTSSIEIPHPKHWLHRSARFLREHADVRLISVALWILLVAAIWAVAWILISAKRISVEARAAASSRELAQTYEAHVVRAVREIDHALGTVKYAYEIDSVSDTLSELNARGLLPPAPFFAVGITDEQGTLVASTHSRGGDESNKDYFIEARRSDALHIARPQYDPLTKVWRLVFSRRLDRSDGTFAGVVFITVDAAYFVSSYEPLSLGQRGMLAFLGSDGIVRARRVGDEVMAGETVDLKQVSAHADDSALAGALAISPFDGAERFLSGRELGIFPAAVLVGLAREEQLAPLRDSTRLYIQIAALITCVLTAVVVALGGMAWKLVKSRQREQQARISSARESGMAEIATNVLHNVGNALNSVNVSATLIADTVRNAKVSGLTRAVALMKEHEANLANFLQNDRQGMHLRPYLTQLADSLAADQRTCTAHLNALRESVEHIKNIVMMQQTLARASPMKEDVDLVEVMEASLQMNVDALGRHSVEVVREYEKVPRVVLDKHGVLQILVNLISNAKHACSDSGHPNRQIVVGVAQRGNVVALSVSDNGVGIAVENLTRIFHHGFTTRAKGHGFGLHSSALAAKGLGGTLTVHSAGIGSGATFTLAIPLQ